jgi:predicted nucleotidyltransferase component of viral defense system
MKEFIEELSTRGGIKRKDLLEKDIIIQKLLLDLSKNEFFSKNFVFKGGTCLIKCYMGYYRFSEDIDFTWKEQSIFKDKSQKEIRRILSPIINDLSDLFVKITKGKELDFTADKKNKDYMEFGGGNKTVTLKIWFRSEILKTRSFIKVQINFLEDLRFDISKRRVNCFLNKENKELQVLYEDDYKNYIKHISLLTYDVKEVLCEKVRAILTRRGLKARDFVDIFFINEHFKVRVDELKPIIVDKINYMLKLYRKYESNFNEKKKLVESNDVFWWGNERELLLVEIDEKKFYKFVSDFTKILKEVSREII